MQGGEDVIQGKSKAHYEAHPTSPRFWRNKGRGKQSRWCFKPVLALTAPFVRKTHSG